MPKKLIVCCDGTGNTQDQQKDGKPCPTHVARVARALCPEDGAGVPQIIFYDPGVGTQTGLRLRGGGLGRGVWGNVLDGYRFLVHNYSPGDKVYLFGFSRGAFTARSLAGLIRNSGLLHRGQEGFEREALELYRDPHEATVPEAPRAREFRAAHSHETPIEFLGVWDTVGALGVSFWKGSFRVLKHLSYDFHDIALSPQVRRAAHALAIHERRTKFAPEMLWMPEVREAEVAPVLDQAWFAGVHSDVGGGYSDHALGDCSLEWMRGRAEAAGLRFGDEALQKVQATPMGKMHDEFTGAYRWFIDPVLMRRASGTERVFGKYPDRDTRETIHPSAVQRYAQTRDSERWPASFRPELERLLRAGEGS